MAASRTPGPTLSGAINHGTRTRHQMPKPGVVGHKALIVRKKTTVIPDSPNREVIIFSKGEFLKFVAVSAVVIPPVKDIVTDLRRLVTELGIKGSARVASYKGDEYIILSGYAGLRKILTGTRYKASNPKVLDLLIGRTRILKSAIKGNFFTVIVVGGADVIEAYFGDKKAWDEVGVTVTVDVMKAVTASVVGMMAALGVAAAFVTAPAWIPVAVGIGVGVAIGVALDAAFPTSGLVGSIDTYYKEHKAKAKAWLSTVERDFMDAIDDIGESLEQVPDWASPSGEGAYI